MNQKQTDALKIIQTLAECGYEQFKAGKGDDQQAMILLQHISDKAAMALDREDLVIK
jgi:RNase P subunit RPR2